MVRLLTIPSWAIACDDTWVWPSWDIHPCYITVKKKYTYIDSIRLWLLNGPVTLIFELYDGDTLIAKKTIETTTGYYATPWFRLGFLIPEINKPYKLVLTHIGSNVSTIANIYEDEYVKIRPVQEGRKDNFIYGMKLIKLSKPFRQVLKPFR